MKKNHTTNQQQPESGLTVLDDGRVQVILNLSTNDVLELPEHIYSLVQELTMSTQPLSETGKVGLYFVLQIAKYMVPDRENCTLLLRKAG